MRTPELYAAVQRWAREHYPGAVSIKMTIRMSDGAKVVSTLPPLLPEEPTAATSAPADPTAAGITDSERDILDTIEAAGKRLTTQEVMSALARANKILGDSTVMHALADLCQRKKLLNNRRDGYGRGYGLADWS